eukprot:771895-Pleurochrysis_carterae.AAC.2
MAAHDVLVRLSNEAAGHAALRVYGKTVHSLPTSSHSSPKGGLALLLAIGSAGPLNRLPILRLGYLRSISPTHGGIAGVPFRLTRVLRKLALFPLPLFSGTA